MKGGEGVKAVVLLSKDFSKRRLSKDFSKKDGCLHFTIRLLS